MNKEMSLDRRTLGAWTRRAGEGDGLDLLARLAEQVLLGPVGRKLIIWRRMMVTGGASGTSNISRERIMF